jgi:hypothetical protein
MLTLTDVPPSDYETAAAGTLGLIRIPGSGKQHGEVVVFTPEQRRAGDDALRGDLASYDAAWQAGDIDDHQPTTTCFPAHGCGCPTTRAGAGRGVSASR